MTRLGRDASQDLQIPDRGASKEHAHVTLRDGRYWIRDAGSRNGTFVNRHRIDREHPLVEGDEIIIGLTRLVFHEDPGDALSHRVTIDSTLAASIHQRLKDEVPDDGLRFRAASEIKDRKQLERDYEKLRIANELNQAVAGEVDIRKLLDAILEKAIAMFGADRGVILLARPDDGELEPVALIDRHAPVTPLGVAPPRFKVSRTILEEVIAERSAILSTDAQKDERFSRAQSVVMAGIKATMSVPLLDGGDFLGIIYLDSKLTAGAFADKDLSLLNGFARQAARAIAHARLVEQRQRELLARGQLSRLLAPALVDQVMSGAVELVRGGAMREATVLFSDIRGFTPLSERYHAQEIVGMLNDYFDVMVDVVFRWGGTLDKFIGDALMAIWGAPIGDVEHCQRAVAAALEMQTALADFNASRMGMGRPEIKIGIGVATGELVAGYMGSTRAMGYTVIGDVVNTAARLCSSAGAGEVLVSRAVYDKAGEVFACQSLPPMTLKGKAEPVVVYRVTGAGDADPAAESSGRTAPHRRPG
ncbi:MAG: adenylate/guanylate cyclase domain-containing protein [Myxococcota bacterium]